MIVPFPRRFTEVKTASTPIETQKPLLKDEDGEEVDVHMYRSMIGSLMYLTSSRPDIMFVVCLWYPKDSHFDLVAYTDSDYARARLDRKSTIGGCQFFGCRLISWQCKKQTVVANSTIEAEYVAASSCCGQVHWIQNQLLDYGYNFMHTKIFIDNKKKAKKCVRLIMEKMVIRENRQRVLVRKRIERVGENKNRKRDMWNKNKQSDLVSKRIERNVNAARHKLNTAEDAEGVDCLPNATIFEQLTLIGSKTTAWNGFSSTMASAVIYLATNQKFNFSKYSFESMVKNLDNTQKPRRPKRKDTKVPQPSGPTTNVADEAINVEMDDSLVSAATTASSLEAEQDRGNIDKTQSKATPNEPSSPRTSSGGNTLRSGEDSMKLQELMELCTNLQQRVLDLETTKTSQANEIASLKRRVKKLEQKKRSTTHGLKRLYKVGSSRRVKSFDEEGLGEEDASKQGRIANIDANKDIYLVNVHTDEDMFGVNDLDGDEAKLASVAEETVNAAATTISTASTILVSAAITKTTKTVITDDEITLAKALAELKSDKGKGKMVKPEPVKKMSKKDILRLDEELAFKLQTKEEEEERLAREKSQQIEKANIAWDDVQAIIEADYQKHFVAKRVEEKRNIPPTRAQQRSIMCTYLKNMEGWKPKSLKNKFFDNIQELFDKAMKRVNTFVDFRTELLKESSRKVETKLEENKKAKAEVMEELQSLIEIVPDEEEVAIDAITLDTKPPNIIDLEDLDLILYGYLKTMFDPHVKDRVWRNQQDYRVLDWKIYDSCGVHSLRMQHVYIHMLVEKRYPITPTTITDMLNKKLQCDHFSEMLKEFDLLKWDPTRGILLLGQQVVSELVALRNFARRYGSRLCTHGGCIKGSYAQTG
ncbi:hypothetical protein Tco_0497769 [Tanacetum coccineum]